MLLADARPPATTIPSLIQGQGGRLPLLQGVFGSEKGGCVRGLSDLRGGKKMGPCEAMDVEEEKSSVLGSGMRMPSLQGVLEWKRGGGGNKLLVLRGGIQMDSQEAMDVVQEDYGPEEESNHDTSFSKGLYLLLPFLDLSCSALGLQQ